MRISSNICNISTTVINITIRATLLHDWQRYASVSNCPFLLHPKETETQVKPDHPYTTKIIITIIISRGGLVSGVISWTLGGATLVPVIVLFFYILRSQRRRLLLCEYIVI